MWIIAMRRSWRLRPLTVVCADTVNGLRLPGWESYDASRQQKVTGTITELKCGTALRHSVAQRWTARNRRCGSHPCSGWWIKA